MNERLTSYGEISSTRWSVTGKPDWTVVNERGRPLFWELLTDDLKRREPEDFLVFLRTAFPNGGYFTQSHCNHALVWSALQDDCYGIGLRRLKSNQTIMAVLETPEEYPGASPCPDRDLSFKGAKFLAEEFLRGTDPSDIFKCETVIFKRNHSWWQYLEKLEKVVNWKYPELQVYRTRQIDQSRFDRRINVSRKPAQDEEYPGRSGRLYEGNYWDKKQDDNGWNDSEKSRWVDTDHHQHDDRGSSTWRQGADEKRSRSPNRAIFHTKWNAEAHATNRNKVELLPGPGSQRKPRCERCNVEFEQNFELMRHYNSVQHQSTLAKEFPI